MLSTVQISRLPDKQVGNTDIIRKFFDLAYPEFRVIDVQFAYNIFKLAEYSTYKYVVSSNMNFSYGRY